ncbi:hypothetical protein JTB14_002324, partial [Gonioctena quinquepunctata]
GETAIINWVERELNSLSTWSLQEKLPSTMDLSEKLSHRTDLIGLDMSVQKEKQILEMDMDLEKYICVNPYEINPIIERTDLQAPVVSIDIPLKDESSAVLQNLSATGGSGFYGSRKKIKLEMEEFSDLSSFLPRPTSTNSVDELNTPIFEKDAFDFDISEFQKSCQADFFVKLEYDANCSYKNNVAEKNTNIFNKKDVHRKESIPSEIGSNNHLQKSDMALYSPPSHNGTYIYRALQSDELPSTVSYNMNDSALSVISGHCSYPTSPAAVYQFQDRLESPDDGFSTHDSNPHKNKLSLDLSIKTSIMDVVRTPNIIADVVDLESDSFNILDLVKDDNIPEISAEDIFVGTTVTLPQVSSKVIKYGHSMEKKGKYSIAVKQPRKRIRTEDNDGDYIPPTKRKLTEPRDKHVITDISESGSECEADSVPKHKPRGRPPKRTESVSSDYSKDSDSSKYRELRDKNNEASRKSRLKRKMKEFEIEAEAEELNTKNIQLKAQVQELEKIVINYKDNIFKIMLNK